MQEIRLRCTRVWEDGGGKRQRHRVPEEEVPGLKSSAGSEDPKFWCQSSKSFCPLWQVEIPYGWELMFSFAARL